MGGHIYCFQLATRSKFWSVASLCKMFYLYLTIKKMCSLAIFTKNLYGHTAAIGPILWLRLIA